MTKTLIDIDELLLTEAQRILGTRTKKDTVNAALDEVAALAARRRDLERFASGKLDDLGDAGVTAAAWRQ
jgi:Arc/MetJ family transcription regulator